ncbi:MAG TPA: heavy metal-binding domain-containing protein [Mycobacteriales bacterium]|nr:heavy metal-binding domain-containing protein [Mycobacteriales bacterium]
MTTSEPPSDDERSAALIAAGRLPLRAQQRLAALAGSRAFTSDLTIGEFEAVRSVGFEPVGQVMGSSVYQIGFAGPGYCGVPLQTSWQTMSGAGGAWAGFGYLVHALRDVRHRAMERARAEAAALGGDGVVAVRLSMSRFPGAMNALEFQAIGTAIRAPGPHRPPRPFLSDLSGQDFAKIFEAGWIPVDIVMGIAVEIRHDDYRTVMTRSMFNVANAEIPGYTQLVTDTRAAARVSVESDLARVGGQVAVVAAMDLKMHEQECRAYQGGRDHIGEATVLGTALAQYASGQRTHGRRLAVLPLSDRVRRRRPEAVINV